MPLTVQEVKNISCPDDKTQIKRSDGNNLFLLVKNGGSKLWRLRFMDRKLSNRMDYEENCTM